MGFSEAPCAQRRACIVQTGQKAKKALHARRLILDGAETNGTICSFLLFSDKTHTLLRLM